MSARLDRVVRAYGPLRLRSTLIEGHWMQAPRMSAGNDPAPGRSLRLVLLALLLRPGRSR